MKEEPIFTEKHFDEAECLLNKFIIRIFIDKGITMRQFLEMHKDYVISKITSDPKVIMYTKNNTVSNLLKHKKPYTYKFFETILKDILEMNLVEVAFTFHEIDDTVKTYKVKGYTY